MEGAPAVMPPALCPRAGFFTLTDQRFGRHRVCVRSCRVPRTVTRTWVRTLTVFGRQVLDTVRRAMRFLIAAVLMPCRHLSVPTSESVGLPRQPSPLLDQALRAEKAEACWGAEPTSSCSHPSGMLSARGCQPSDSDVFECRNRIRSFHPCCPCEPR